MRRWVDALGKMRRWADALGKMRRWVGYTLIYVNSQRHFIVSSSIYISFLVLSVICLKELLCIDVFSSSFFTVSV